MFYIDDLDYDELCHDDVMSIWNSEEHPDIEQVTVAFEHGQWWASGWNQEDEIIQYCLAETNMGYMFEEL